MRILLTGGTGYIGGAVLRRLLERGHHVIATARSTEAAATLVAHGAEARVGDALDLDWLTAQAADAEGAIHAAGGGPEVDDAIIAAVQAALLGAPFVATGGIWIWGTNPVIIEDAPLDPPEITAWRLERESAVLASPTGAVIHPGIVYGHGGGIPQKTIVEAPRDDAGALVLVGSGEQHWATVHVDDLAELYVLVLEQGIAGRIVGASGVNPTVRELGEAVAGEHGVVAESVEATRERLGRRFADALLLDQQAVGAHARELGWSPSRQTLVDELAGTPKG